MKGHASQTIGPRLQIYLNHSLTPAKSDPSFLKIQVQGRLVLARQGRYQKLMLAFDKRLWHLQVCLLSNWWRTIMGSH